MLLLWFLTFNQHTSLWLNDDYYWWWLLFSLLFSDGQKEEKLFKKNLNNKFSFDKMKLQQQQQEISSILVCLSFCWVCVWCVCFFFSLLVMSICCCLFPRSRRWWWLLNWPTHTHTTKMPYHHTNNTRTHSLSVYTRIFFLDIDGAGFFLLRFVSSSIVVQEKKLLLRGSSYNSHAINWQSSRKDKEAKHTDTHRVNAKKAATHTAFVCKKKIERKKQHWYLHE